MSRATQQVADVRAVLDQINSAWLMAEPDQIAAALAPCFDEEATIVGTGFVPMANGKLACVASYVDFKKQAEVHSCTFTEPVIHIAADTAVVTSAWEIAYTMDGTRFQETGQDVYVFAQSGGAWSVVWRAMLSS